MIEFLAFISLLVANLFTFYMAIFHYYKKPRNWSVIIVCILAYVVTKDLIINDKDDIADRIHLSHHLFTIMVFLTYVVVGIIAWKNGKRVRPIMSSG